MKLFLVLLEGFCEGLLYVVVVIDHRKPVGCESDSTPRKNTISARL